MPKEQKSRRDVINAIKSVPAISALLSAHEGHFDYELDLEVTVYGRNYNGKKVGPYVRLLTYDPGEEVIKIGDWGGNTFYFLVNGTLDVFVKPPNNHGELKVAELAPGTQFGEMSVLAGVPRNATIKPPPGGAAQVLEVQRPALRLLRKLPKFSENLDNTYRKHGRDSNLEKIKIVAGLPPDVIEQLKLFSVFRVFSKNHLLFSQNEPVKRLYIVTEGWLHRVQETPAGALEDFLGHNYCLGAEGLTGDARWPYSMTLMGRTEVIEISLSQLRALPQLRDALARTVAPYGPPPIGSRVNHKPAVRERMLEAQERIIETGLVDGTNLLVMDMDLCVRCGNCSLACHKIHGQSRLTRRGIHVTRLEAPRVSAHQSVLSPEVCMHCKDPECLTGCPTGAIGRFGLGQVDIDPKTCIGCGDCATQCPYNAISMVPRKSKEAPAKAGFGWKLRDLFGLKPDPLPPPVDATEDLVAIKCNLCSDRETLNPPGKKSRAYSCEENCPTGALARINPREYFREIGAIEGLMIADKTHAFGRNIHRSDPPKKIIHTLGILLTALFTAATIYGLDRYGFGAAIYSFLNMRWLTGIVGLVGIAVVMIYPARRQVYRKRRGPLRYWMLVHAYAGLIAGILILLHGGNQSGGLLTTALMISWDLVIFTGIVGIISYLVAPRILTRIEGTPLLLDDLRARREELQKEVASATASGSDQLRNLVKKKVIPRFMSFGYLLRQYLKREDLDKMIEAAKQRFARERSQLVNEKDRMKLDRAIESVTTLRRIDALVYLHRSMKLWLPPHVATTSLMLALMIVHIIQVIYYASR
ncbi:MAG TPA: cyclic nucleotide-binding domain-containing protein [Blastocatellia bacterium]|nr:cyclic nucleotide-binding domain-containing protein [Blastocatellia bacterium]